MADYQGRVYAALKLAGCYKIRDGKGSHEIWHNPDTGRSFTVARRIKSRHTANAILKQAGLSKAF